MQVEALGGKERVESSMEEEADITAELTRIQARLSVLSRLQQDAEVQPVDVTMMFTTVVSCLCDCMYACRIVSSP